MAKKPYGDINRNRTLPNSSSKKNNNTKKNPPKEKPKNLDNTTKIRIEKEKVQDLDHSFLEGRVQEKNNRSKKEKDRILMEKESKYKHLVLLKTLFFSLSFLCLFLLVILIIWNHFSKKPVEEEVKEEPVQEERVIDSNYLFVGDFHTFHMNIKDFSMSYPYVVKSEEALTTESLYHNLSSMVYIYNPSVIFMEVGLEDLGNGERVEDIIARYKIIIKEIQENRPNAHIYVESIYPVLTEEIPDTNKYKSVNNATIKKVNQELKTMASDLKVHYVDLYSALLEKNQLKKDYAEENGVFLNQDGYKKIWSVLRDIIEEEK